MRVQKSYLHSKEEEKQKSIYTKAGFLLFHNLGIP